MAERRKTGRLVQLCGASPGYQHFYSLSDGKVYSVNLSEYTKEHFRATPGIMAAAGPLASLLGILFGDMFFANGLSFVAMIFIGMLWEIVAVYILMERSLRKQGTYILSVSTGRSRSRQELQSLYAAGKRARSGMLFFIVLGILFSALGLYITFTEFSAQGLLIFYLGVFIATDFMKLLSPLRLLKAKRQFG